MKNIFIILILTLDLTVVLSAQTGKFNNVPVGIIGLNKSNAAWGDYDDDGDLDVVVIGQTGNMDTTILYKNVYDGSAAFVPTYVFPNLSSGKAVWGDCDNDGDLDLLLGGKRTSSLYLYVYKNQLKQTGTPNFIDTTLSPIDGSSFDWADFDNDGDLDIIAAGSYNQSIYIYVNNQGSFSRQQLYANGLDNSSLAIADFNGDGYNDFFLSGCDDNSTAKAYLFLNQHNMTFDRSDEGTHKIIPLYIGSIAAADMNNDGKVDIAISGQKDAFTSQTRIYFNNGDGVFSEYRELEAALLSYISLGDCNGDGRTDIAYCGKRPSSSSCFSRIDTANASYQYGQWTTPDDYLPKVKEGFISIVDFDNDGYMDLLITGLDSIGSLFGELLQNNQQYGYQNTAPTQAPVLLTPIYNTGADSITLFWTPAQDTKTPKNGLTYNMYVVNSDNGNIKVSPNSKLSTGYRQIMRFGNTGHDTTFVLHDLDSGLYHWRVQAIDNGYKGSLFSANGSFSINPVRPPTLQTQTADSVTKTSAKLQGTVDPKGQSTYTWFIIWDDNGYIDSFPTDQGQISVASAVTKTVTGLSKGQKYYYKVKANPVGTSNYYYGNIISFTTKGINIADVSCSNLPIKFSDDLSVTVHVYADQTPGLKIYYGSNKPNASLLSTPMIQLNDSTYQKNINFSSLNLSSMWFCIHAENANDTAYYPSKEGRFNVPIEIDSNTLKGIRNNSIFGPDGGLTCSGWHTTSLPYDLGMSIINLGGPDVFNEPQDFNTRDGNPRNWSAYTVNRTSSDLIPTTQFISGQPYFIYHTYDIQFIDDHIINAQTMDVNFYDDYYLHQGWNLVPWVFNYEVNFSTNATSVEGDVYYMKGNSWVVTDKFKPYQAYAIKCKQDNIKLIDAITISSAAVKKTTRNIEEWQMQFKAELPDRYDHYNFIGSMNGASDGYDDYDASKPWDMKTNIRVYFPLKQNENTLQLYKNFQSTGKEGYSWDMMVENPIRAAKIYLNWVKENLPANFEAVLIDLNNNKEIDLRVADEYEFKAREMNLFKIIVGNSDYINKEIENLNLPDKFSLHANYPNPFNPGTTIKYDLKLSSTVRLSVYNALGQLVRTLVNGKVQTTGSYSAYWDGKDALGRQVASGVYFYRINVKDINGKTFRKSRKMILLK